MEIYEVLGFFCALYCAGSLLRRVGKFLRWAVDEWQIIPVAVGQRVTLTYVLGWWSGRLTR